MFNRELLKRVIAEQREQFLAFADLIARDVLLASDFEKLIQIKEAIIITGARRSGKSYLLKMIWQKLCSAGNVAENNFFCLNFEDERLMNFEAVDFDDMLDIFFEMFSVGRKQKIYLFFDEIQVIKGWEKFINRLLREEGFKIFIAGSNAALLSKEIDTALTGRSYPINLFPLSFAEFARYKMGRDLGNTDLYRQTTRIKIKKIFNSYVENGGFPEVVLQNFRPLLQEYLRNIIYRDIVLRYKIKQEANLKEIAAFAISNIGNDLSLKRIAQMAKMKNITTVKNYLSYLENSFLFYRASKHSYSLKTQIYNPDKFYVVDHGFYNETAFSSSSDKGKVLENMVYMELKREYPQIYYYRGKKECDFVVKEKNKITQAIQTTVALNDGNRQREIGGLLEAMDEFALKEGLILTESESARIERDGKVIEVKPIWQWCLR